MGNQVKQNGAENIEQSREAINKIDREILKLMAQRRAQSNKIGELKGETDLSLRDLGREEELLVQLIQDGREAGIDSHLVTEVFHQLIHDSLRIQQGHLQRKANSEDQTSSISVAYQGTEGTYGHLAAMKYFSVHSGSTRYHTCATYRETLAAVETGQAEFGLVPIENTTSGGINEVYDLLIHTPLSIIGEEKYKIDHCLVGLEGTSLADLQVIYGNPHAILQCSEFLSQHPKLRVECYTGTAPSVARIRDAKEKNVAAIANEETARRYGLSVIRKGIANSEDNYTRYLIVSRTPRKVDPRILSKTSLVMATSQEPGSLVRALSIFEEKGITMTKLESRPMPGNPGEEMFYIDIQGNVEDARVQGALDEVRKKTKYLKVLGSYPAEELAPTRVSPLQTEVTVNETEAPKKQAAASDKPASEKKIPKSYKLASREFKSADTVVEVGGIRIGGDNFIVMAGPCSVESKDQIMTCAKHAKENGAVILRGGCFKPRTSPYSFQGLGLDGLDLMIEAGRTYGLPVITEVLAEEDLEAVAAKADMIQIGARNMQNYSLLRALGRIHRPVMLKRGMSSSLEELLQASEYILAGGNQQVILCERGIRTFETATRSTLDISAVPVLRQRTHLPIIIDPSHAAGERDLVPPLAMAAKAVGAHGIIVEFHPKPEEALSDGPQALYFPQFAKMMRDLHGMKVTH